MLTNLINVLSIDNGSLILSYLRKLDGENLSKVNSLIAKIISKYTWPILSPVVIPVEKPHSITILDNGVFAVTSRLKVLIYSLNLTLLNEFAWAATSSTNGDRINSINSIAYSKLNKTIYIADNFVHSIKVFNLEGKLLNQYFRDAREYGLVADMIITVNNQIIITDEEHNRIFIHDLNMRLIRIIQPILNNAPIMNNPIGITLDLDSNIIVANWAKNVVQTYDPDGKILLSSFHTGDIESILSVEVNKHGNIIVPMIEYDQIGVFDKNGNQIKTIGSHGSDIGQLNTPFDIAINTYGDIYVCDQDNNRVQIFYEN